MNKRTLNHYHQNKYPDLFDTCKQTIKDIKTTYEKHSKLVKTDDEIENEVRMANGDSSFKEGRIKINKLYQQLEDEASKLLMSNTNLETFFGWVGGKNQIASEIITRMPKHEVYIELFTGSGIVFMRKQKAQISILNDINKNLINLFKCCYCNPLALVREAMYLFDCRELFEELKGKIEKDYFDNLFKKAAVYLYLIRLSFNNEESYYYQTKPNFEQKGWGNNVFGVINNIYNKIREDVVFENLSFEYFIDKYKLLEKSENNIFLYVDPPYYVANNTLYYKYVFTNEQHILLAELMKKMPSNVKFIISYDNVPEIKELYNGLFIENTNKYCYSMNTSTVKTIKPKSELLISNFKLSNIQKNLL